MRRILLWLSLGCLTLVQRRLMRALAGQRPYLLAGLLAAGLCCPGMIARGQPAIEAPPKPDRAAADQSAQPRLSPGDRFIRIRRDGGQPTALETAIVDYSQSNSQNGTTVSLIAAVHVGEKSYYEELNRRFRDYDVVLYELVAPEGTRVPAGGAGPSLHPVGLMQNALRSMLKLDYQLDQIDYQQTNLVHADMSPEQFAESMRNRGESFWTMFFRMLGKSIAQQAEAQESGQQPATSDADILRALFSPNRATALKLLMAEQFEMMDGAFDELAGPEGSTLISERNKVALDILRQQLADGKRRIGIFYGAGHMADFQERLAQDFQLTPHREQWLVAWNLKALKAGDSAGQTPPRDDAAEETPSAPRRPNPRRREL